MISSVSSRQTSILDLPNNLILLIFARISNTDCCNVARACKHFASLVDEVHKKRFVLKCWLDPSVCSSVGVVDDSLIIMGGSVYYDNTITEMRSRIVLQDLNTLNASTVIDGISFTEADKILFIDSVNGYFFGGNHNTGYSNRVFRYNIHTSHFDFSSPGSIAPSPRSAHSSVAIDGKIYIFGGWNLNTDFGDLWCFTPFKLKEETFFNDDLTTTFEPFDDSIESDSLFLIRDISEFDNAPRSENLFLDFSSWNTYRNIVSNFLRYSTVSCLHFASTQFFHLVSLLKTFNIVSWNTFLEICTRIIKVGRKIYCPNAVKEINKYIFKCYRLYKLFLDLIHEKDLGTIPLKEQILQLLSFPTVVQQDVPIKTRTSYFSAQDFSVDPTRLYGGFWRQIISDKQPQNRRSFGMDSYKDCIYVFGGYNHTTIFNDFWEFNTRTEKWNCLFQNTVTDGEKDEEREIFPCPRGRLTMAIDQKTGRAFLVGGTNGKIAFCDIFVFDIPSRKWSLLDTNLHSVLCCCGMTKSEIGKEREELVGFYDQYFEYSALKVLGLIEICVLYSHPIPKNVIDFIKKHSYESHSVRSNLYKFVLNYLKKSKKRNHLYESFQKFTEVDDFLSIFSSKEQPHSNSVVWKNVTDDIPMDTNDTNAEDTEETLDWRPFLLCSKIEEKVEKGEKDEKGEKVIKTKANKSYYAKFDILSDSFELQAYLDRNFELLYRRMMIQQRTNRLLNRQKLESAGPVREKNKSTTYPVYEDVKTSARVAAYRSRFLQNGFNVSSVESTNTDVGIMQTSVIISDRFLIFVGGRISFNNNPDNELFANEMFFLKL